MPGALVVVQLPLADTTQPEASALIAACTAGLGDGRCELAETSTESESALAIVSFRGSKQLDAQVEVGRRAAQSRIWRTQRLAFRADDARIERFRALGLAIATLFRETEDEPRNDDTPTQAPRSSPPAKTEVAHASALKTEANTPVLPPAAPASSAHAWLSAGASIGYDRQLPSSLRFGGRVALGVAPLDLPAFATLSGEYAVGQAPGNERDVDHVFVSWTTLALGVGGYLRLPADFMLRGSAQGVLVDLMAHAKDEGGRRQESQRWVLGGQLGVELVALQSRTFGCAVGFDVQHLSGATALVIHDRNTATIGALSWSGHAMLEFRPFRR